MRKPGILNLILLFLACVCLVPGHGAARAGASEAREHTLEERISVFYGGSFTRQEATSLLLAMGWLRGLALAADELNRIGAVRLADLDPAQRQALAAVMDMPKVMPLPPVPDAARAGSGEMLLEAAIGLNDVDARELSLCLARTEQRQRHGEVIAALSRIVPRAWDLADRWRDLRLAASRTERGASGELGEPGEPGGMLSPRLGSLIAQMEAYTIYRKVLASHNGTWDDPARLLPDMDKALALAPQALPILISQGEMLLSLDRPAAVLRGLERLFPASAPEAESGPPSPVVGGMGGDDLRRADTSLHVRGLRLRALAQLSLGHMALAENDLDSALALTPEQGELWLARGALKQIDQRYDAMCGDYRQACTHGLCDGLAAARRQGYCQAGGAD